VDRDTLKIQESDEIIRPVRFSVEDNHRAFEEWGFNCGPGALCAVLNLTPDEIRPKLGSFERKRYTDPELMLEVLARCGADYSQIFESDDPSDRLPPVSHGLVRIQWGGPWALPGMPMFDRYRKTHWIAIRNGNRDVFDVNAMSVGGWLPYNEWTNHLVPWLCGLAVPEWDGTWWATHAIEVKPR